jgi:hypothetical protein
MLRLSNNKTSVEDESLEIFSSIWIEVSLFNAGLGLLRLQIRSFFIGTFYSFLLFLNFTPL